MKEKQPAAEKMGTIMMLAEGRKVLNILTRIILEHIGNKQTKIPSILILMQQHWLPYHCREFKMDILNIISNAGRALFSREAITHIFVF